MPSDLLTAYKALYQAVEQTYGVNFNGDEEKIVAHLFELYADMVEQKEGYILQDLQSAHVPLISSVTFNDGTVFNLNAGDIVVFVGPNNVGKSRSIKDIHSRLANDMADTILITDSSINVPSLAETQALLERVSVSSIEQKRKVFTGPDFQIRESELHVSKPNMLGYSLTSLYSILVDNDSRAAFLNSWSNNPDGTIQHPLSGKTEQDRKNRETLKASFFHAFGQSIVIDQWSTPSPTIRLGEDPTLPAGPIDERAVTEWVRAITSYPALQDQGDGMKSFAGTITKLMDTYRRAYFLDEPEAFLHPPQMEIMGACIADSLSMSQQAFVSTHSKDLIIGLVETAPERIKIVRITREGNTNRFNILNNEIILSIWKDPLLRHSNILDAMFYESAAVCEADADCQFYKMIQNYEDGQAHNYNETLFVHCGGKGRLSKVAQALSMLEIPYVVVGDFDLLKSSSVLKELLELRGIDGENDFWTKYRSFFSSIKGGEERTVQEVASEIEERFASWKSDIPFCKNMKTSIEELLTNKTVWDEIKKFGVSRVPRGEQASICRELIKILAENSIYLVPVGQIEGFVPDAGNHGPGWLANVIDRHPSLDDAVYEEAKEFVHSWIYR